MYFYLISLFLSLLILFFSSSCCSTSELKIPHVAFAETRFDWENERDNHTRIYSMPCSCLPQKEEIEEEKLLPYYREDPSFSGLDAMIADDFALLKNRSFALLSNTTSRDQKLNHSLDIMISKNIRPSLLLEPEHGMYGDLDKPGPSDLRIEKRYGIPILSLYSKRRLPSKSHLRNIDVIVVDIQNLPVRCYTYISTLSHLMYAVQRDNIELMILDRPNPYGFWKAKGSYLQKNYHSFVGLAPVPFLYSLTTAEYARYLADVRYHNIHLEIVKVENYKREDGASGVSSWVNPSPNIPSLESALVYVGVVFFEGVEFNLGRGTTRPFVYSGAPWLNNRKIVQKLRELNLPGVSISQIQFTPTASYYEGEVNKGVMIIPKSLDFDPLRTGYEYMRIVRHLHPRHFQYLRSKDRRLFIDKLWGGPEYRKAIDANLSYEQFRITWLKDAKHFEEKTKKYRLY